MTREGTTDDTQEAFEQGKKELLKALTGRPLQRHGSAAGTGIGKDSIHRTTLHYEQDVEKIRAKIAALQLDVKISRSRMGMFSRELLLNRDQYETWAQTIDDSLESSHKRAKEFAMDLLLEGTLGFLGHYSQETNYAILDEIIFSKDQQMRLWLGRELRDRHIELDTLKKLIDWTKNTGDLAGLVGTDEENWKKHVDALLLVNDLLETSGLSKAALRGTAAGKWFYLTKMAGETAMDAVSIRWAWAETRKLEGDRELIERNVAWLAVRLRRVDEETQCLMRCLETYTENCDSRCTGRSRYSTPPPPLM